MSYCLLNKITCLSPVIKPETCSYYFDRSGSLKLNANQLYANGDVKNSSGFGLNFGIGVKILSLIIMRGYLLNITAKEVFQIYSIPAAQQFKTQDQALMQDLLFDEVICD
jgi:hypothetical protein